MSQGFTLWFTGLSGAGKSTLANQINRTLLDRGLLVEILDGDVIRTNLSKGLGFSKEDRDTNIRRIGWVCEVLTRNNVVAVAAAISPYSALRDELRGKIGRFVEIFCKCSLDELERRDVKGLYAKARAGEIKNFTGIDDPYEEPHSPEVTIHSDAEEVQESASKIVSFLEQNGFIPLPEKAAQG